MARRAFETTTRYLEDGTETVFTSLRGLGVSVECWIELKDPARWGVRVRANGTTHRLGDKSQAPGPQES